MDEEKPLEKSKRRAIANILDTNDFEFVRRIPVMHQGWGLDETGYLVKVGKSYMLLLTNHGSLYIAGEREISEKLSEYHNAVTLTEYALTMISQ